MGARSEEKATQAIQTLIGESPSLSTNDLRPLAMDLGDFKNVQEAARRFLAAESRLDILVNNAGM